MSQVTIYLDDTLEQRVRRSAKSEGISVSKWIAQKIEANEAKVWPRHVLDSFGTWSDVPDLGRIRSNYGRDARRARLD